MRLFGWANDTAGCGQYRVIMPMWALQRGGHEVRVTADHEPELPMDVDVVVGQRINDPGPSQRWQEFATRSDRPAMVYELDDDLWNVHGSNTMGIGFRESDRQARIAENIAAADAVTVTTEPLAEIMRQFNPNVHVIPNMIDASLLNAQRPAHDRVTVGWAGGSSHQHDFETVQGELRTFLHQNPDVDIHLIGHDYRSALRRPDARHSSWEPHLREYLAKVDFDIGIAPIAFHAFNKSKSDLKILEYAALGIPSVATDFGPYSESIQHGVTGFLVRRRYDWIRYLRDLCYDTDLRAEIARNAHRWAETRTVQANIWRWEEAFRSAIGAARSGAALGSGVTVA